MINSIPVWICSKNKRPCLMAFKPTSAPFWTLLSQFINWILRKHIEFLIFSSCWRLTTNAVVSVPRIYPCGRADSWFLSQMGNFWLTQSSSSCAETLDAAPDIMSPPSCRTGRMHPCMFHVIRYTILLSVHKSLIPNFRLGLNSHIKLLCFTK